MNKRNRFSRKQKDPKKVQTGKVTSPPNKPAREETTFIKKGFARAGDLVATVEMGSPSREGKDVFGRARPANPVKNPRIMPRENIKQGKDQSYYMGVDGTVEVLQDKKGNIVLRAERYANGSCRLRLSEDEMQAFLSVSPPVGKGRAVGAREVMSACAELGISDAVDEQAVNHAVGCAEKDGGQPEEALIAKGSEPENGEDGQWELKAHLASGKKVRVLDDGHTDFKHQDLITEVTEGQLLVVRTLATKGGRDGRTVTGKPIKAEPGNEFDLTIGNNIRVVESGRTVEYYSEIDGQLLTSQDSLTVEPVMTVTGDVGPKSGNIEFNGVVVVTGDVDDHFEVHADKGIVVEGNVGNSLLVSNADIDILSGVVGKDKGLVAAKGNVSVKFVQNANIQAEGNINIHRAAMNCRLVAGGKIISLEEKGQIIGGESKAKDGIEVKILGNDQEHETMVSVGKDFILARKIGVTERRIHSLQQVLDKMNLILKTLHKTSPEPSGLPAKMKAVYDKAIRKKSQTEKEIKKLTDAVEYYSGKAEELTEAKVIVRETLHRGVQIYFGKFHYPADAEQTGVALSFDKKTQQVRVDRL